jgi:tRNA-modifying protein YgfZ
MTWDCLHGSTTATHFDDTQAQWQFHELAAEIAAVDHSACISPLTDCAILAISGEEAESFLQGQVTIDVSTLSADNAAYAAHCNRKGRVIANFHVVKQDNQNFWLITSAELLPTLQKSLQTFALFSKVNIDSLDSMMLFGLNQVHHELNQPTFSINEKIKLLACSADSVASFWQTALSAQQLQAIGNNAWHYHCINQQHCYMPATLSGKYLPQMLNLDQLEAISFNKGCYIGQEIVARTQHLGKIKKIAVILDSDEEAKIGQEINSQPDSCVIDSAQTPNGWRSLVITRKA